MADVRPFRAFRYNPARVSFDRVLTQPYDKISPEMQDKYYAADPHNLITVEKGRAFPSDSPTDNVYTRASSAVEQWITDAVLAQDPQPSFYAYTQEYTVPGTTNRRTRFSFIGAGKLEEYSAGVVFRHEHTLSGPKADRLDLLRHTQMHTGQLFMLYSDEQRRIDDLLKKISSSAPPATEILDEYGVTHRLWVVSDPQSVATIQKAMNDQKLVIADGHHRYETALTYRNERRAAAATPNPDAPYERAMMTFVNIRGEEPLTILPTHRVASNLHDFSWTDVRRHLEPWFTAEEFKFTDAASEPAARKNFLAKLVAAAPQRAIGAYPRHEGSAGAFYVLTLRPGANLAALLPSVSSRQRELDVVLLHDGILEPALGITPQSLRAEANLKYEREAAAALDAVNRGQAQIAFLLNACQFQQVMDIAIAGEVMPQKSTDFFPKLMSGIALYQV